jgi:citrate synthase
MSETNLYASSDGAQPDAWLSAITDADDQHIRIRGYEINDLMKKTSFADVVYLLHQGKLPTLDIREIINAILVACADHGTNTPSALAARMVASGNRRGMEAAIAAGILSIGDAYGGVGSECMEMIHYGLAYARQNEITIASAAAHVVTEMIEAGRHIPGLGLRTHKEDPRVAILLGMMDGSKLSGDGIAFLYAIQTYARQQIAYLPINIYGMIGAVLHDLGFPPPYAKLFFIIGRVAGLSAQVMEEYTREKPRRISFPVRYDGPKPRALE